MCPSQFFTSHFCSAPKENVVSHTAQPVWKSRHRIPAPSVPRQRSCILTAVCEVPHCCYKWPVLALSLLMRFLTALKDSWLTECFSTWLSSQWIKHCDIELIIYQTGTGLNSDPVEWLDKDYCTCSFSGSLWLFCGSVMLHVSWADCGWRDSSGNVRY